MFRGVILALALSLPAVSAVAAETPMLAEITGDHVRVRAGPATIHAILTELSKGDLVVVLGVEGDWKKVRVPGGFPAYVHQSLVRIDDDGTAVVKGSRVLLRPTASKDRIPLEVTLDRGDVLPILGRDGEWVKVIAPERIYAWVYGDFVRTIGPADEAKERIAKAAEARQKKLLGDRPEIAERAAAEKRRREDRKAVIRIGKQILEEKGQVDSMAKELGRIALESDDDLTRGYAQSLLALLDLRRAAEKLESEADRAKAEKKKVSEDLEKRLKAAQARYEGALATVRELRTARENPFRGVGRIEKKDKEFVLVEKGRVVFKLVSRRFDLGDYVGRRVGVNGRMVGRASGAPVDHLMVETIEILGPEPGSK